jgi:aspartate/methionine/tyrosine aminotransferase
MRCPTPHARPGVQALRASKIREVANAGIGRDDIAAFWFGEPDEVTPAFIRQAAIDALASGDTFYTHNLGIPELREALAGYITGLHRPTDVDNIAVTNSGMSALMIASQSIVGPGDHVVAVTPLWPNLVEIPKILGAEVTTVALRFTPAGWRLDLDQLIDAMRPGTAAVFINSPNNPTGWTIERSAQQAILEHCRRHGIWIVADDAYERLCFSDADAPARTPAAPSFLDIADEDDRVLSTNTFSKSWLMTGFRLGWIVAPRLLAQDVPKLIEYNTSCAPPFVQRAGVVAVTQGEPVIAHTVARLRQARNQLVSELQRIPGIETALPGGAMYAFFRVHGVTDSLALCKRMVGEVGLGLAPGIAFGPEGEGFVRWCFAAAPERLADGISRLRRALAPQAAHR